MIPHWTHAALGIAAVIVLWLGDAVAGAWRMSETSGRIFKRRNM